MQLEDLFMWRIRDGCQEKRCRRDRPQKRARYLFKWIEVKVVDNSPESIHYSLKRRSVDLCLTWCSVGFITTHIVIPIIIQIEDSSSYLAIPRVNHIVAVPIARIWKHECCE